MIRDTRSLAGTLFALSSFVSAGVAEVVGPYAIIDTPISAELLSGGGGAFNWLNTNNAPVSVQEAFTGFSVIAEGYANANAGTTIRLTYAPGAVRNDPGPDLVIFDASAGDGDQYLISTDYDNFAQPLLVFVNIDTGVDRTYFYGGAGPFAFDVMGAPIELTQLGVPAGVSVTQLRVFTEGGSCDLLGVGVLLSGCAADLDGDGSVGLSDLSNLLAAFGTAYGQTGWNSRADLNADGDVGLSDLAALLAAFGTTCS
jgi:hypothetical protein